MLCLLGLCLLTQSSLCYPNINTEERIESLVVVVNAASSVQNLSKKQVIDIYMGRFNTFPDGTAAQPIDFPSGSREKQLFYERLVGKDEQKVKAYWSRLLFSGRATPPVKAESKLDVINLISNQHLAYLDARDVTPEMKIVYQF
jgi:hypothetical protein